MRLPARFQSKYITWYFPIAQLVCKGDDVVLRRPSLITVPKTKAPLRWHKTPTRKNVVPLHCVQHVWSGEQIDVDAGCMWNVNDDDVYIAFANGVGVVRIGAGPNCCLLGVSWFRFCITKIEGRVSCRVDQDTDPFCCYIKRNRRVRVAGINFRVGIHAGYLPFPALRKGQELQSKAKDLLVRPQRKLNRAAAICPLAVDWRQGRAMHARQLRKGLNLRRHKPAGYRSELLRLTDGRPPYTGIKFRPGCSDKRAHSR